ncbi:MAG: hypothetical protein ACK4HC_01305 [Cloacibacterium sp.]
MKKVFLFVAVGLATLSYAKNLKKVTIKKENKVLVEECCTRSNTFGDVTVTKTVCGQGTAENCIIAANQARYEAEAKWRKAHLSAE